MLSDAYHEYQVYDFCNNFTLLTDLVQNPILDDKCNILKDGNFSESSIIAFFMYTPLEMTNLVKNIFTRIPVYDIDLRIQKDWFIYNPVDSFVEDDSIGWICRLGKSNTNLFNE